MPTTKSDLEKKGRLRMRPSLLERLASGQKLVCDGAMGTELQRQGLPLGMCGDVWNLDNPDAVAAVHRRYVEAGADLLLTNTFSTNRYRLSHFGRAHDVVAIAKAAVALLRREASPDIYVCGEMGPLGEFLEPVGEISREDAVTAFRETAEVFAGEGMDAIIIETITAPDEMECAVEAVRAVTNLPLVACFTFEKTPVGLRTMTGATPEACAQLFRDLPVDVVGCNCGTQLGLEDYAELVRTFAQVSQRPVIVEPNAGTPELVEGKVCYKATPEAMAQWVPTLLSAGASVVGGCCGTTPDHIRAMAAVLKAPK